MFPAYMIYLFITAAVLCLGVFCYFYFRKRSAKSELIVNFKLPVKEGTVIKLFDSGLDNSSSKNKMAFVKVIKRINDKQILVKRIKQKKWMKKLFKDL